ncbi:M56 family metallopeptidase [Pseudotenacibaculum sp. MALMAid0570]|uniref:M56 family metallopeptidase n=1 Tax=Pseudotenacibaculum sp. MALMAid0570 TaxID=3143938 RepID=UPI0032DE90CD
MISYLIKSGLCLAILLAFYHLVLEREKMHQFNRFYLLGSVLFSFLVPFFIIYVEAAPATINEVKEMGINYSNIGFSGNEPIDNSINFTQYFIAFYIFVSSVLLIRFLKSLIDIVLKIKSHKIISYKNAKIVLVNDAILPHTFWNYIFINKEEFLSKRIETELFTHELTHVTQRHTLDVLIVEFLQIILWFNPFFYPLKKAIQLNHEFLADDKVIASHQDITRYQYLLLDKAAWKNKYYLASNLNYSLTKKRLLMMKTPNSKASILIKKLAIIPLLTGLVFLFADRVEAQSKEKKPQVVEVKEKEATKTLIKEYRKLLQESEKKKVYKLTDVRRMRHLYNLMSKKQKQSVKNINDLLPPPPPPSKKYWKQISANEYEKLKDGSKYSVWINDRSVKNSELNKYKNTDFVAYLSSFIHKNARSEKHPQPYQYTLFTESYYNNLKPEVIEVRTVKNTPPPPPKPVKIEVVKGKATKAQMKEYKEFEAFFSSNKKNKVIKERDYRRIKKIYNSMSGAQKRSVKKYTEFIPAPPPPRKVIEVKESDYDEIEEEIEEKIEEIEETEVPVVVEIREVPEGVIEEEIVEEAETIEESEIAEEVELVEVPQNKTLTESFEELVKKGAKFYLNGKKIFPKKAKKYFYEKKNEVKTIDVIKNKKGKYKVKLRV